MQQQVLGSNIFTMNFFDDLYCYRDAQIITSGFHIKEQGMIVTTKEYPPLELYNQTSSITKEQQLSVAFEILKHNLPLLQYPIIGEGHLINPFEEKMIDSNYRSITSLKLIPLLFQGKSSLIFDVRKINFTQKNCLDLAIGSTNKQIVAMFQGKMVRTIYFQKEYWFKVTKVLFDFDIELPHKNKSLADYLKFKHKMDFGNQPFIFETGQQKIAKRYLVPELCELNVELNDQLDCTQYCGLLVYWNNIFNFNQQFIQALKDFKLVLAGSHVEISLQYLDPGTLALGNGISKKLSSLVYPRNQSEFDQYYENFFLASNLTYTTNLKVSNWIIFRDQYNLAERESFDQFFEYIRTFSNSRNYKINQPTIMELGEAPFDTIKAYFEGQAEIQIDFVFVVGNKKMINSFYNRKLKLYIKYNLSYLEIKFFLLTKGIANQFLVIPLEKNNIQQVCHRILAQIAAKLGSVAWSIKEINGQLGQLTPCAVLGISVQRSGHIFIIGGVLSVSKSMNKYTSHYYIGPNELIGVKEVVKTALAAFYSAQSQLPNYLIVIREILVDENVELELETYSEACDELIDHVNLEQNKKLAKPQITMIVQSSFKNEKYFTQLPNDLQKNKKYQLMYFSNPNYAKHPSVGTLICVNEDINRYSLCTERDNLGCSFTNQIQVIFIMIIRTRYIIQEINKSNQVGCQFPCITN